MWAMRRRAEIIGIVLGALLLFVVFPYWLTHREIPTCFDGKQNQEEEGIDCGSPCSLICKGKAQDLNVLWAKVFAIRTGVYDVAGYIENPNFNTGAPKFIYTARLFDKSGAEIASKTGEDYALPNERFVIFAGGIETGEKVAARGSLEITPDFQWFTTEKSKKLFSVTDKALVGFTNKPKLSAVLHNDTTDLYRNINVATVIFDNNGQAIGVSSTRVDKILPGGSENLSFTWPAPFNYIAETEKCDTPVDVVLAIDRSGSMAEDNKIGQAKQAAAQFVTRLSDKDQGAYVSFANDASNPIDQPLTNEIDRLTRAISKTQIKTGAGLQYTNIGDGFRRAIDELQAFRHNSDARPVIIMLTDGIPTYPKNSEDKDFPSKYTRQVADEAKKRGIAIYTIGLGEDLDARLLQDIATSPEYFYSAASGAELGGVYQQIATAICQKGPSVIEIIPRVQNVEAAPSR
jgi:uncharacterized protein YegL